MNWGFIGWVAGIVATLYAVRFLMDLFKSLFGKEARGRMINNLGDSISDARENMTEKIRMKAEQRREEKRQKKIEEDQPMIIIR